MMRSFLDIGALEVSSWVASVSVTMVALSSSSRGLLDMEEVPGVAETRDEAWVLFTLLPDTDKMETRCDILYQQCGPALMPIIV